MASCGSTALVWLWVMSLIVFVAQIGLKIVPLLKFFRQNVTFEWKLLSIMKTNLTPPFFLMDITMWKIFNSFFLSIKITQRLLNFKVLFLILCNNSIIICFWNNICRQREKLTVFSDTNWQPSKYPKYWSDAPESHKVFNIWFLLIAP